MEPTDGESNGEGADAQRPLPEPSAAARVEQTPVAAIPEGGRDPRLEAAQRGYEMGLSLRTVGAQVGVSEAMVRKWAKAHGWVKGGAPAKPVPEIAAAVAARAASKVVPIRPALGVVDGGGEVRAGTQDGRACEPQDANPANPEHDIPLDQLFRARVQQLLTNPTRDEAADVAARAVVQVVQTHRVKANRLNRLVDEAAGQLEVAMATRDVLETLIVESTAPGKAREAMLSMVSLPAHAKTIKDLATSLQKLTQIERQAFGLANNDDPTPAEKPPEAEVVEASAFDRIRERVQQRLGAA